MGISQRKDDHIRIAASQQSQWGSTLLDQVLLLHDALPEMDLEEVDLSTEFLGRRVSAPLMVGAMTGGTELAGKINGELAKAAEEFGIAMYVGSQRVAIERPETRWTFEVVKRNAPSVPKIANLGAPQISRLSERTLADWAAVAVDMVDASALAVHLNPAQEAVQPEGEPHFSGVLARLRDLKRSVGVPLVVKEVGNGISREVAVRLASVADVLDVGGAGGTSFVAIEGARAAEAGRTLQARLAETFRDWGIPTAASICEARGAFKGPLIASGGIRNGLDGARALALGADYFSMSQPLLKAALGGSLREEISAVLAELRVAMFLTGSRSPRDLRRAPRVYGPLLEGWIRQRGLRC